MRGRFALCAALLALCSATATAGDVSPARHAAPKKNTGWMARAANARHPWLYVAGYDSSTVGIFDVGSIGTRQIGAITQGVSNPDGIALDAQGTLYVANVTAETVTEYPAGALSPSLVLAVPGQPVGVAVDASGDVDVSARGSKPGIAVYAPGQTTPSSFVTSSLMDIPAQVAFDSAGNLDIAEDDVGILVLPPGPSGTVKLLDLKHVGSRPSGIAIDPQTQTLYVVNSVSSSTRIRLYPPGSPNPGRARFPTTGYVNFLGSGLYDGHLRIFAPSFSGDIVYVYDADLKGKPAIIGLPFGTLNGVAFKAAAMP
jgi:DNA-binding beta-propeller fold protein YncE